MFEARLIQGSLLKKLVDALKELVAEGGRAAISNMKEGAALKH
jgi:hypothetical protein